MQIAGWLATVLDNGILRAVVLPAKGGDVWELRHLASGTQVLWQAPWGLPQGPAIPAGAAFDDWYAGGWQDLLPNGDAACTVAGVEHGFHGESWALAWRVEDVRRDELRLAAELRTAPLRVSRTLRLSGATLAVHERVEHAGGTDPATFMWGHHPALGGDLLEAGCVLELPGGTVEAYHEPVDVTSALAPGARSRWPLARGVDGGTVDLSAVPGPSHGTHDVALVTDLEGDWYALRNPARDCGLALRFPRETFRWLWIWQAFGGARTPPFGPDTYTLAVEPWTSPPVLARAADRGEAARLEPGGVLEATIEATAFSGAAAPVVDVRPGGRVETQP